jgi:hypothetical protein
LKKKPAASRKLNRKRQGHPKFPHISEEMKEWSALLQSELNSWPGITTRSMFGFLFFYRRGTAFAALPRTRGFDSPSSLVFKFNLMPPELRERAQADSRMDSSHKASSKGWWAFRLNTESDLRDALFWLNHAYESIKEGKGR